jgi:hypothetical protein
MAARVCGTHILYPSAAYGVMVRLTVNELVRGFVPPVVAVTVTA